MFGGESRRTIEMMIVHIRALHLSCCGCMAAVRGFVIFPGEETVVGKVLCTIEFHRVWEVMDES